MQGMRRSRALALPILACLYALASPAGGVKQPSGPPVGSIAPEFTVRNALTGEEMPLSSQHGKVVVLTFWATWCPSCRQELPVLERIQEIVGKDNLCVLAVNYREHPDAWRPLKKLAANWGLTLIDDHSGSIAGHYKVSLIPHLFIIDREGRVLANHLGYGTSMNTELAAEVNRALAGSPSPSAADSAPQTTALQPEKEAATSF